MSDGRNADPRRRRSLLLFALLTVLVSYAPSLSRASTRLQTLSYTSDLLSRFWGTPVQMIAKAFVPARCRRVNVHCAVMYHLPSYGGFKTPWLELGDFVQLSVSAPGLVMAHVLLDTRFTGGHDGGYNYFTDSQNNGPWSSALTTEFIPYVENQLGVGGSVQSRFLEGYSSGGWA